MNKINVFLSVFAALLLLSCKPTLVDRAGSYMLVDFHQHTGYTDGHTTFDYLMQQGVKFGVDVMVNSEHGGTSRRNAAMGEPYGHIPTWIESGLSPEDFKGDVIGEGVNQQMWRWQNIKEFSFQKVLEWNQKGTATLAIQGVEWNPPGHEHASVGIITGQFDAVNPNADAVAQFEYMFDAASRDQTGGIEFGWEKPTTSGKEKTLEAAQWLQTNHRYTSWIAPNHPERVNRWHIEDYRNLLNIAPDVFFAFEGMPGHQASRARGGIGNERSYQNSYTFGGVGIHAAKIGGVWDALLSEGRHFWLTALSDFHSHASQRSADFYPGEYSQTYVFMKERTAQSFVDGLRSGNIFCVFGNLIDILEFTVGTATMGETYHTNKSTVHIRILVRNPETDNHNQWSEMTNPVLHHIDLIAGEMRPIVLPEEPEYSTGEYDKVKVIARFDAKGGTTDGNGITSSKWKDLGNGVKLIEYKAKISGDTYFRLRGTNNGLNVPERTDNNGNPLEDMPTSSYSEAAKTAFEDLWFYSNPIFVQK
jgi:hypothetical protein